MSQPARLKLILHADDLGISYPVNDAIFHLMDMGQITSASILANGPAFEDAAQRSHYFPNCSFGVHLNITEFAPLHPCNALRPALSPDGDFQSASGLFALGKSWKRAVVDEWARQVRRVRQAGVSVSHIDSHHHVHTHFSLLSCTQQLCREQSIRRVRLRHTLHPRGNAFRFRIDNRLCNWILRRSFQCTDEFGSFAAFAFAAPNLPAGATVELMVHPGHPAYVAETRELERCIDEDFHHRHQCITYRDLD